MSNIPPKPMPESYTTPTKPSDIDRAVFLGNAATDNLYTAVMAMAAELWTVRRRQKVIEAVLEHHELIAANQIETYIPTAAQAADWLVDRDAFVKAIYGSFTKVGDIPYHTSLKFEPQA